MQRKLITAVLITLTCTLSRGVTAQAAPDSTLLRRSDSLTVGDYCRVARSVLATPAVIPLLSADSTVARLSAAAICDPMLSSFSLRALLSGAHAPLAAVARLRTGGSAVVRRSVFDAMSAFRVAVRRDEVRAAVKAAITPALDAELINVTTTSQGLLTAAARDGAVKRLARYERKLGPTSARLNAPEVFLNYAAQRWLPGFRAHPLKGPSPLEIVASYAPGYATVAGGRVQAVSASEFGLRRYLFGEKFGAPGIRGMLYPSYWSAGVITASDRNGALVWPWEGRDRLGGYVSWGAVKVAYVRGRQGAWLISKQFQAVPFLF